MYSTEDIRGLIRSKGMKATPQRVAVLDYLLGTVAHPTATAVYEEIVHDFPSITKATVYNCISALCEAGLASQLSIDDPEARYDAVMTPHGHIKCSECGKIENIAADLSMLKAAVPEGFEIMRKEIIFTGICKDCKSKRIRK